MPDHLQESSPGPIETSADATALSFREFLRHRAKELGIGNQYSLRMEWVGALRRFLDQIENWLRQSDPDGLLEIEEYEIRRTEPMLGTYEAPALKIRLGAIDVDVVPVSRAVSSGIRDTSGNPSAFAGRVEITDDFRKSYLFRAIRDGEDHWLLRDDRNQFTDLDRDAFERILRDLLS